MNRDSMLKPTLDQRFEIVARGRYDFVRRSEKIDALLSEGRTAEACNERFHAFQDIAGLLPEEEATELRWEHRNSAAAIDIVRAAAVDQFLLGDLEMSEAMLEMVLDIDPEDHTGAVELLALCYAATGEWELFDEMSIDLSERSAAATVVRLWAAWRRERRIDEALLQTMRRSFKEYLAEFTAQSHDADEAYMADISSSSPSHAAEARELWLQTEPLWREYPDFVEALRDAVAGR
ncbi:MAG: hypothetical protein K1V69_01915 [Alistipes sp.]